jgi:hypothetical protein
MVKNTALSSYKAGVRAARGKSHHHKKQFTLPLAAVAGFVPLGLSIYNARAGGIAEMGATITKRLTGYDPDTAKWDANNMKCGTFAIILGAAVHWLVGGKLGVNRMIARAGVPIFRI